MPQKREMVTIFIEGDTEIEFYNKLLSILRKKNGGKLYCDIEVKNVKGIGNYKNKVCRVFEKAIKPKYPNRDYTVVLCYDSDVFEYNSKPPVDLADVSKTLKQIGATCVEQVKAVSSIEDWFLYDIDGLRRYLKISPNNKLGKFKGQKGLAQLFLKSNKTYIKGTKCNGLVECLDVEKILPKICSDIRPLCNAVGLNCDKNKLCK